MCCTLLLSLLSLLLASFTLAGNRTAAPPYFDKDPTTDVHALEGGRVKFLCKAQGTPKPFLLWYKDHDFITPRADRIRIAKYALQIYRVVKSDKGVYRCEASNQHGKKWVNYTLSVVAPPHFHRDTKTRLQAFEGQKVKFRCKALGKPRPRDVVWYRGDQLVGLNHRINISKYALHIDPVAKSDEGVYRCEAFNEYGKGWLNYTLSVEDAPNQTAATHARSFSTTGVNSGRLFYRDPAFIGGVSVVVIVVIIAIVLFAILWRRYKKRKRKPVQAVVTSGARDVEPMNTGTFSSLNLERIPITTIAAANTPLISSYNSQPPPMTAPSGATTPLLSSSSPQCIHTTIPSGATTPLLSSSDL